MPLKWKFFVVLNWAIVALHVFLIGLVVISIQWHQEEITSILMIIFTILLAVLLVNCINNLHLIQKYYPQKMPVRRFVVYSKIVFGVSVAALAIFLFVIAIGIYDEFSDPPDKNDEGVGKITLIIFGVIILANLYACWNQVVLRKTLRRNFQLELDNFLNA